MRRTLVVTSSCLHPRAPQGPRIGALLAALLLASVMVNAQQPGSDAADTRETGPVEAGVVEAGVAEAGAAIVVEPADDNAEFEVVEDAIVEGPIDLGFVQPNAVLNEEAKAAMVKQFSEQLQPVLKAELHFLRKLCDPTADQLVALTQAGNEGIKIVAEKTAVIQHAMQFGFQGGQAPVPPSPNQEITAQLLKVVKQQLPAERYRRYEEELERRQARLRQITILNFVAQMDSEIQLTRQQRTQVEQVLTDEWRDEWQCDLRYFTSNIYNFPPVNKQLRSILTRRQLQIWSGIPNHHTVFFGGAEFDNLFFEAVEQEPADKAAQDEPAAVEAAAP